MKSNKLNSRRQQKNFARIPIKLVDSQSLSFSEKKILLFLYGIQVHWHIPISNVIRGWKNNKDSATNAKVPRQLRQILIDLEARGYIKRCFENGKFTAVQLNNQHPETGESKYFYLDKSILSDPRVSLNSYAVIMSYARFYHQRVNYTTKLSAFLGVDSKTFRKSVQELFKLGYLSSAESITQSNHKITTYKLSAAIHVECHTRATLNESIHREVGEISLLKIYFLQKILNNTTMQGIIRMETRNQSKTFNDYLLLSPSEMSVTVNAVHYMLQTAGAVHTKDFVRARIIDILLSNKFSKTRFEHDQKFYAFLVKSIRTLHESLRYDPLQRSFMVELQKELPINLPLKTLEEDIQSVVAKGFTFKSQHHAMKFFQFRYLKKPFSEDERSAGTEEIINTTPLEEAGEEREPQSIGEILRKMYQL